MKVKLRLAVITDIASTIAGCETTPAREPTMRPCR